MIIDYWSRFGDGPVWSGLSIIIGGTYLSYAVVSSVHLRAVKGTERSYRASTIMKTLCLPLFGAFVFSLAMDIFTSDIVGGLIDAVALFILYRDWQRIKDNDDWWKGRGKKLRGKLKSLLTGRSPVSVGGSA